MKKVLALTLVLAMGLNCVACAKSTTTKKKHKKKKKMELTMRKILKRYHLLDKIIVEMKILHQKNLY